MFVYNTFNSSEEITPSYALVHDFWSWVEKVRDQQNSLRF